MDGLWVVGPLVAVETLLLATIYSSWSAARTNNQSIRRARQVGATSSTSRIVFLKFLEGGSMFYSPRPNLVESDEGFSVEVLGQTGLLYKEGDRTIDIYSELLVVGAGIGVWKNSINKWRLPHDKDRISEADQTRIVANICRAISFQGEKVDVIG